MGYKNLLIALVFSPKENRGVKFEQLIKEPNVFDLSLNYARLLLLIFK